MTDRYANLRVTLDSYDDDPTDSSARDRFYGEVDSDIIRDLLADYDEAERALILTGKVNKDLMDTVLKLTTERDRLRDMLIAVVRQLDNRCASRSGDDAPGHSHEIPGVWDSDNGDLAGKLCAWCALWREAKALAQEGL